MNGNDIKKAAINKAKQVATAANNAANGNGGKKRRKGQVRAPALLLSLSRVNTSQDLKPIITTEDQQSAGSSPNSAVKMNSARYSYSSSLPPRPVPMVTSPSAAPTVPIPHYPTRKHSKADLPPPHPPKTTPQR